MTERTARRGVLHITGTKKPPLRFKVNIRAPWLGELGFVCGAAVWAVPENVGFTLVLRDGNAANTADGGKLIHVGEENDRPTLILNFAKNFATTGLSNGDFLAATYEYGRITAKKLPSAQKYYIVGETLRLYGSWLENAGFTPGSVVFVAVKPGEISLRLWHGEAINYAEAVKLARSQKYQIVQPQKNQNVTFVDIDEYLLNRAGFETGDFCGVRYQRGLVELFRPDI